MVAYWYQNPEWLTALGTIGTATVSVAALLVAIWAANEAVKISKAQTGISRRLLDLEEKSQTAREFIDISVQALPMGFSEYQILSGVAPARWFLIIKAIGIYPVYLTEYAIQNKSNLNDIHLLGNAAIPPDGYKISYNPYEPQQDFNLIVKFENHLGEKYQSTHRGIFSNAGMSLEIRSDKKNPL